MRRPRSADVPKNDLGHQVLPAVGEAMSAQAYLFIGNVTLSAAMLLLLWKVRTFRDEVNEGLDRMEALSKQIERDLDELARHVVEPLP